MLTVLFQVILLSKEHFSKITKFTMNGSFVDHQNWSQKLAKLSRSYHVRHTVTLHTRLFTTSFQFCSQLLSSDTLHLHHFCFFSIFHTSCHQLFPSEYLPPWINHVLLSLSLHVSYLSFSSS